MVSLGEMELHPCLWAKTGNWGLHDRVFIPGEEFGRMPWAEDWNPYQDIVRHETWVHWTNSALW